MPGDPSLVTASASSGPSYRSYDDIAIDGVRATGKTAVLDLKRIAVQPGVMQVVPCGGGGMPRLLWIKLRFRDDQREIVRAFGDDVCRSVNLRIGERDMMGVLQGDLLAIASDGPPSPATLAPVPGGAAWVDQADAEHGISFSMPALAVREGRGYHLTHPMGTYAVDTVSLPDGAPYGQVIDSYLSTVIRANSGRRVDSKAVTVDGLLARDVVLELPQQDAAGERVRASMRLVEVPARRFLLVASVTVSAARESGAAIPRFFASVRVH